MRRFFFHYYRAYKCMSVHWKGQCMKADDVVCSRPVETKWNKTQPQLILRGFATDVTLREEDGKTIAYIT
jgi:hypothetical protein